MTAATRYTLTIDTGEDPGDPDGIRSLRAFIKVLLRRYGMRCIGIEPVRVPDETDALIDRAMLANGENLTA